MARYSRRQERPDKNGQWYRPQETFTQEREFDAPRTCKGPCKAEKLAAEFIAKDGKNMVQWCKDCRLERFEFLKKQRRAKKPPAPGFAELVNVAKLRERAWQRAVEYNSPDDWDDLARLDSKLKHLQEDYKWTSVRR